MVKNQLKLKNTKTPKLRFPGFSGEWSKTDISKVLKIGGGKDYKHLKSGKVPVFGTGGYMLSVDKFLYSGESVMIGRKGTIDKPFYYNGDFWTVDTLFYTHNFDGITPRFTNYIFQKINWKKYNEASGVPSLSKTTIEKIKITIPTSLNEQQKIAEFLGSTDKWIENLKAQKELFESYKKIMIKDFLTGKIRYPGFKDKWKYKTLECFAADKKYSIVDGPFGSQMKVHEFIEKGVPVIEMDHLSNDQTILKATRYISYEKFETIKRSAIYSGDILISKTGTIGLLGIATTDINPGMITSRLAKISLNNTKANTGFIFYCLLWLKQNGYWSQMSQGGTMQVLGTKMIKEAPIPDISLLEQEKIGEFLTSVDKVIESKQQQILGAELWKKGLMLSLFV
jgi:type I restriction enzyme S subunit